MINPRLAEALTGITVRPDGLAATVHGRELTAENRRELRNQLYLALYQALHAGTVEPIGQSALMPRQARDPGYEELLEAAVPHAYGPENGEFLGMDDRGPTPRAIVRLPEVVASVPLDRLDGRAPVVGENARVLLDCRRPNVSPGFYYVVGSRTFGTSVSGLRRIFFHVTDPVEAVETFRLLLLRLEESGLRYHAKIISSRSAFPRRDGIVVYLPSSMGVSDIGEREIALSVAGRPGIGAETSVYTEPLAPGIGCADDPVDHRPGQLGLSFGQHRSMALATALTRHAAAPGLMSLPQTIAQLFREAGIDPLNPARNLRMETADV